jgi:hypothetical protein
MTRLLVGDGTVVRKYFPTDENEWMQGARLAPEFGDYKVVDMRDCVPLSDLPLLLAYRLPFEGSTPESITADNVDISKWTVEELENERRVGMVLRNASGQLMVHNVLNPANAFAVEKTRIYSPCFVDNGGLQDDLYYKLEIKNEDVDGLWLPKSWIFTMFSPKTGQVASTVKYVTTKMVLHPRVDETTFTIDIPEGALVRTSKGPKKMVGERLVPVPPEPPTSRKGRWAIAVVSFVSAVLLIALALGRRFVSRVD